jgi:hypothetical protein|tara:strand:- start:306 stop:803 length:498 start_codon:yes stop_codon:yes gene_type:complete
MATSTAALVRIFGSANITATSPYSEPVKAELENATGGRRWKQGTGSGQVDRAYMADGSLGAGATDDYNLLAAGSLVDVYNQAIDADELKGVVIRCETGEIEFRGDAANALSMFTNASEGITLAAGQSAGFDLGAAGIDVTTDSKFEVFDSDGGGSTYTLWLIVAQ